MTDDRIQNLAHLLLREGHFNDQPDAVLAAIHLLACADQLMDERDLDATPHTPGTASPV
jgi:hypothetical protein